MSIHSNESVWFPQQFDQETYVYVEESRGDYELYGVNLNGQIIGQADIYQEPGNRVSIDYLGTPFSWKPKVQSHEVDQTEHFLYTLGGVFAKILEQHSDTNQIVINSNHINMNGQYQPIDSKTILLAGVPDGWERSFELEDEMTDDVAEILKLTETDLDFSVIYTKIGNLTLSETTEIRQLPLAA